LRETASSRLQVRENVVAEPGQICLRRVTDVIELEDVSMLLSIE
jgi:hypothetical protein